MHANCGVTKSIKCINFHQQVIEKTIFSQEYHQHYEFLLQSRQHDDFDRTQTGLEAGNTHFPHVFWRVTGARSILRGWTTSREMAVLLTLGSLWITLDTSELLWSHFGPFSKNIHFPNRFWWFYANDGVTKSIKIIERRFFRKNIINIASFYPEVVNMTTLIGPEGA